MGKLSSPLSYARTNRLRFVSELKEFVQFPSISVQPKYGKDLRRCAVWLAEHLQHIGLEHVRLIPTSHHPLVFAEWKHAIGRPTLLIYGHYDVQPADPLNAWNTSPFQPVIKGLDLLGRGTSDDKGQLFSHLKAMEAYLQTEGELPVNVKCVFEGEEEIGSPNLQAFLNDNRNALDADVAVISDMRIPAPNRPAITYALRGALSLELEVRGPQQDLHSGSFGGAIHNPLQAICEIIARLHNEEGRITIPGFYEGVRLWSQKERAYMRSVGPSGEQILRDGKTKHGWGEAGYTPYELITIRPSLTVNGITGGYQGPGVKAIIPAIATAKINFRLVPDQKPEKIAGLFRHYITQITPSTVTSTVRVCLKANPALVNRNYPAVHAAAFAYQKGFGMRPIFLRSGGTIPVVNLIQQVLDIPTVLMGFALPDDNMHAPNEKFHLPNFFNAIVTSIWYLKEVGSRN